jgi:hypothetical protein
MPFMNDSSIHEKKQKNLIVMFSESSYTVVQTSILCLSNDAIYANLYLPLMNGGLILFFCIHLLILEVDARRSTMVRARIHHCCDVFFLQLGLFLFWP